MDHGYPMAHYQSQAKSHSELPFRLKYCNFSHWPNENKRTIMATWLLEQLWPQSARRPVAPTVTLATPANQCTAIQMPLRRPRPRQLSLDLQPGQPAKRGETFHLITPPVTCDRERCKSAQNRTYNSTAFNAQRPWVCG